MNRFMIYGAAGYTGSMVAKHAASAGLNLVLAGREKDRQKLETLGNRLRAAVKLFSLDESDATVTSLAGISVLLNAAGTIDKETMRTFDEDCLVMPRELSPGEIKALREDNHVSQPIFARYLNTSQSTVQKWETGAKRPSGPALKLLSLVQKHGLQMLA